MRVEPDGRSRFLQLNATPYHSAVVAANRAYLAVAVPDPVATERHYWTLSCLPSTTTNPQRLSAVSMRTMETFVLHEPLDPANEGVAEGFVVVRRSSLKRHWPTARALRRAFSGLTEEPSDYRDAGPDQARIHGRYDQLIAALADVRFAEAVRDLTSALLTARTMQGAGHNVALVDEVLGRAVPTGAWVYPVNDQSETWGNDQDVVETFRAFVAGAPFVDWHLSSCFHQIKAGDQIWVYATKPRQRIVAAGTAWTDPYLWTEDDRSEWRVEIRWDEALTRFLLAHPVRGTDVLDKRVQTVRALHPMESARLSAILDGAGAPEPEGLPEGRRRRLAQVTARQGQAEFRRRLVEAYDGRCAITGCDVPEVLQAAHIDPYDGPSTNRVTNGLLLRADLHNLFDAGQLWVDDSYRVRMADGLGHYARWKGQELRDTVDPSQRPDRRALERHRRQQGVEQTPRTG